MEFFDKLGKKASEVYKNTADQTSKLAKTTKIKMAMGDDQKKINELYTKLGEKVFRKYMNEEIVDESLAEDCREISGLADKVEQARKDILELQEKKQCKECHTEIELNAEFCPKCGTDQK